ncbi:MAG: glutamine amidotransferase, partial [Acidobacteria bacterium]|nr:glutamine amidotransferase [Acidobacteriota bacterium]
AGLIMLGGFHSFGPGGYANTPLASVLPVEMTRLERQNLGEPLREDLHLRGPLPMVPSNLGLSHVALMLADKREENKALWAKLPPLEGANRFGGLAPGAVVLADDGRGHPLLVDHNFGDGRVLAFAGDSTWRWWLHDFAAVHKRFWRQIVLWLAKKDETTESNVWVRLEKRRFAPAELIEFTAGARSPQGEPVADAQFDVQVVLPDGTRRQLRPVRQGEQVIGSLRDAQTPGDYAIEVTATHGGEALGSARARLLVYQQDLELDNAAADSAALESLAAMTGGQSLAPEQLPELIQRLAKRTQDLDVQQETKTTPWDKWPFFLALVGLLGAEWYLRKRWGLV